MLQPRNKTNPITDCKKVERLPEISKSLFKTRSHKNPTDNECQSLSGIDVEKEGCGAGDHKTRTGGGCFTGPEFSLKVLYQNVIPKILLTNIQSLKPKVDKLSITAAIQNEDIICITETWLSDEIETNFVNIPGYCILRKDRKTKRGGGTTMYIKGGLF